MTDFDLFAPVSRELAIVEADLRNNINTPLPTMKDAATHLVKAGGKRLRPAFALLSARLFSESVDHVIPMAVALELIHMASLVHDDVIDDSSMRRGRSTVKHAWGNRTSIYAGNYVFARSLSLVASYERNDLMQVLADASMQICEGEIRQMMSCYNVNQGLKDYLRHIERKTALLISVSCQLGAMISQAEPYQIQALRRYGYYLGMSFQITDDILDFVADEEILGKPVGSDVRQGVITLPVLYALRYHPQRDELARLLSDSETALSEADQIIDWVIESGGIEYAYEASCKYARKSQGQLRYLPEVKVRDNLHDIATFITVRNY